ncbi:MAG: hypothetical protein V4677_06900 [Bacteroidota bacterium]
MIFYIGVALVICRYAKKNAYYDLDIVMYSACALESESMSHQQLHDSSYNLAKQELGEAIFKNMTDSAKYYRNSIYKSAKNFYSQLPFYKVKPLYVGILKLANSFGVSPVIFSTYINLLAYLGIGIALLYYFILFIGFYKGWLISLCMILLPMVLDTIKNNTPDMLASFFIIIGVMLLLANNRLYRNIAVVVFCLSVFIRTESIIFATTFCAIAFYYKLEEYSRKYLAILFSTSILCYLFVSLYYHAYPWTLLYKHSFLGYIPDLKNADVSLSLNGYIHGLRFIPNTVFYSDFFLILLFLVLPFLLYARAYWKSKLFVVAQALLISVMIRVILFPDLSIRFYTGIFIISVVLFFRILLGNKKPKVSYNFNSN